MENYIDDMLQLTARIAEELLLLKDIGGNVSPALADEIASLAEMAQKSASLPEPVKEEPQPVAVESVAVEPEPVDTDTSVIDVKDGSVAVDVEETGNETASMEEVSEEIVAEETDDASHIDEPEDQIPEEKIAVANVADLRKAFSLNDLFYYRRTLFHGSQSAFNDALGRLASVTSSGDIESVLADEFGIDITTDEAVSFISLVSPFIL